MHMGNHCCFKYKKQVIPLICLINVVSFQCTFRIILILLFIPHPLHHHTSGLSGHICHDLSHLFSNHVLAGQFISFNNYFIMLLFNCIIHCLDDHINFCLSFCPLSHHSTFHISSTDVIQFIF